LGISLTPIITTLGFGSLAVAIALQDTLGNFFAGLYIKADRPIKVGHYFYLKVSHKWNEKREFMKQNVSNLRTLAT